jgi:hemerythrin superfamily protein
MSTNPVTAAVPIDHQQSPEIVDVLALQHAEIRHGIDGVRNCTKTVRGARYVALIRRLTSHERAEKAVIYPTLRATCADAAALLDDRLIEERRTDELIAKLRLFEPSSDEFMTLFDRLAHTVVEHATNEEACLVPLLRTMTITERADLARRFLAAQ